MKKTIALLLSLVMLFAFAACGEADPAESDGAGESAAPEESASAESDLAAIK